MEPLSTFDEPAAPMRWVIELALIFKTLWLHLMGRLYVFRDVPDWFLVKVAALRGEVSEQTDDDTRSYIAAANAELRLRVQRVQREIERLASDQPGGANTAA